MTDEERALDVRDLVRDQPDFVADLTFFRSEAYSGGGGAERIARKGNRYRQESPFWIFVGESGKPSARLYPNSKTYNDLEPARYENANSSQPFNPQTLASDPDRNFRVLGAVIISGHRCLKIEVTSGIKSEKIYLYAARDLKNLIIVAQYQDPPRSFVQRLENISLAVPDHLVEIPRDYQPIPRDRWTKVETAQVTYKGSPSKDYGVFRAPGGELFIWVDDAPYPWHYLVRPQTATVEGVYRGLLVTRAGQFIWETKETEAFSETYYRAREYVNLKLKSNRAKEERRVIVTPNSVKFRSNDYEKDRALIEVRW